MNCPKCNKPNREKAVFCKWCGTNVVTKATEPLRELVGMETVKNQLQDLVNTCESLALRAQRSGISIRLGMDMIITGNTGTGKTKLAGVLQKLLYSSGIIKKPAMKVVDAVDYEEFAKEWEKNTADLKGGILCIENVQKLLPSGAANDINKLDKLFSCMDKWNNDPIVILSGLSSAFKEFLVSNPDVRNRFEYYFDLKDFSMEELKQLCIHELKKRYGIALSEEADAKLERVFKNEMRQKSDDFGNGHLAVKKAADIFANTIKRDPNASVAIPEDIPGKEFRQKSYEEIMAELDEFVGIDEIKATVQKIINKIDFERERKGAGAKREVKDHFLFLGNPGTGKTTIARIFADILNSLEVLPIGQLVEVSRKELVAGYVGQTALAVEKYVDMAMGGVLFIDEAYTLKQGDNDQFGQEAIDTLLKLVEDRRGQFVAIAAGYTKEMGEFLSSNSGMASRFNETVTFRDYKADELTEIFRRQVKKEHLTLDEEAEAFIRNYFSKMYLTRTRNFGNAREVRNAMDRAIKNQGVRLLELKGTPDYDASMVHVLTRADIEGEESKNIKSLDVVLAELNEFVGMDSVKAEIRALANKIAMDLYHQYRIYHSIDGQNWELVVDKSDNDKDVPHDYIELREPLKTHYLKIVNEHVPSGNFAMSGFRIFGNGLGEAPAAVKNLKVERSKADKRNAMITWEPVKEAYAYNIYYGIAPDKLYNSITVLGDTMYDFRGLDKDTDYYFSIEALGESGRSPMSKVLRR